MKHDFAREEVEIRVTREVLDISTFGGPEEHVLGEARTQGTATGDLRQLAVWYMAGAPTDLAELDSRLAGFAIFIHQPRAGRHGIGIGEFVVNGEVLIEGQAAREGRTVLRPGKLEFYPP